MKKRLLAILLTTAVLSSGCSVQRAQNAILAQQKMVGLSSEKILSCMGVPMNKAKEGKTEVWSYNSGGGTDSFASGYAQTNGSAYGVGNYAYGSSSTSMVASGITRARYCVVNIVFQNKHVTSVNYSGRTGGLLTQGEQCSYAVQNCVIQPTK